MKVIAVKFGGVQGGVDGHNIKIFSGAWYSCDEQKDGGGGGGGATRPLPRDRGVEEFHGDPTIGPRPKVWTRGQKWKK